MINLIQIQRLVQLGHHRQIIERILPAGRCRSRQAVGRLAERESAAAAAMGLALMRTCELSYMPAPLGRDLAGRLLAMRRPDRLFGDGAAPCVAASAAALRGLIEWRDLCPAMNHEAHRRDEAIREAIDDSVEALAASQNCDGLLAGDAIGSAIALSLLGDRAEFRAAVDINRLNSAIDSRGDVAVDLSRYAHAMAA